MVLTSKGLNADRLLHVCCCRKEEKKDPLGQESLPYELTGKTSLAAVPVVEQVQDTWLPGTRAEEQTS